jgi:hypothetical protein
MKLIRILLFLLIASNLSCQKSSSLLCGGDDPDKTLPWLKNKIEALNASPYCFSVSRSTYKNETVFILASCDPLLDSIPLLFDCDGKQLNLTTAEYQNLNFTGPIELIWKNK